MESLYYDLLLCQGRYPSPSDIIHNFGHDIQISVGENICWRAEPKVLSFYETLHDLQKEEC